MQNVLFWAAIVTTLCSFTFSQDLRITRQGDLYGYVDRSGTWIIKPHFIEASGWEDGVAQVMLPDGTEAFIDEQGHYLMEPRTFQRLGDLREGLASFEVALKDGPPFVEDETPQLRVGFVDARGQVVIPPSFRVAYDFSEGVAAASAEPGKCGYIDKSGAFVIRPRFDLLNYQDCGPFSEGLAHVKKGGKHGYIDHAGNIVIRPMYEYAFDFSEGFAVVGIGSKYGFIDKHGRKLTSLSYSYAHAFSEGLAAVATGKWGFIDKTGALVIPAKYEDVGDFSDGLARVQVEGKCGYINSQGDIIVPLQYDDASDFWDGMAEVANQPTQEGEPRTWTVINRAGFPVTLRNK